MLRVTFAFKIIKIIKMLFLVRQELSAQIGEVGGIRRMQEDEHTESIVLLSISGG